VGPWTAVTNRGALNIAHVSALSQYTVDGRTRGSVERLIKMVHTMTQAEAYDVLEIHFDSSTEDIKRAYKRKALETHPDKKGTGDHSSFLRVSEAYKRLTDPDSFKDEVDGNEDDDNEDDDDDDDEDDYGYRVMVDPSEMEAMFNVMFGAGEASFSFGSAFADAAEDMHAFGHRGAGVGGSISMVDLVQMMMADEGIFMGDGNDEEEDEEEDDEDYEDEVEGGWRSMMYRRMAAAHGHDDDEEEDDDDDEEEEEDDEGSEGDESDDEYDEEDASDDDGVNGGGRRGHGMDGMDVAELLMAQLLLGGPLAQLGQMGALGPMGAAGSRADLGAMDPMAALAQHLGGPRGGGAGAGEGARLHSAFYRGPRAAAQSGSSSSRRGGGGGGGAHASERVEELDSADDEWETEDEDDEGEDDDDDDQWETESEGEGERDKGATRPLPPAGHTHTGRSGSLAK